eukprot:14586107-Ditylum_brightwellii.AAC.1
MHVHHVDSALLDTVIDNFFRSGIISGDYCRRLLPTSASAAVPIMFWMCHYLCGLGQLHSHGGQVFCLHNLRSCDGLLRSLHVTSNNKLLVPH